MRALRLLIVSMIILTTTLSVCAEQLSDNTPRIQKKIMPNGLTLIFKPEQGSGLVAIVAMVKVGANNEGPQYAGIGRFLSRLLLTSTGLNSAEEVAAIADSCGGNISTAWGEDFTEIRIVTTTAMFSRAMLLIGDSLNGVNFQSRWIEQVRTDTFNQMNAKSDDVFGDAYETLRESLYAYNGYGRPEIGVERTLRLIQASDLEQFYRSYYVPNNIVISVVGDIDVNQAAEKVERSFSWVPKGRLPKPKNVPDETLERCSMRASEVSISTGYLMLGWLAPGVNSTDYPAMVVAANALGAGKGSLMFRELRQKKGMGYDVGTVYPRYVYQSHVMAYILTDPFKESFGGNPPKAILNDVKGALLAQVSSLKSNLLSDKDLDRAKGYTIGSYALSHQRLIDRAYELAWLEASGMGFDTYNKYAQMINSVTAEDVRRVARKYFTNYSAVILLPKIQSKISGE